MLLILILYSSLCCDICGNEAAVSLSGHSVVAFGQLTALKDGGRFFVLMSNCGGFVGSLNIISMQKMMIAMFPLVPVKKHSGSPSRPALNGKHVTSVRAITTWTRWTHSLYLAS